jgi:hypothetical protein
VRDDEVEKREDGEGGQEQDGAGEAAQDLECLEDDGEGQRAVDLVTVDRRLDESQIVACPLWSAGSAILLRVAMAKDAHCAPIMRHIL